MTLLVFGASQSTLAQIRVAAGLVGMRVSTQGAARPDWVLVPAANGRQSALTRYGLPSYRVVEMPGLGEDAPLPEVVLAVGFERMYDLGPHRPTISPLGVRLATMFGGVVPIVLERVLGRYAPEVDCSAVMAVEKRALRARPREERVPETPEEARLLSEKAKQKAARKETRRTERRTAVAERSVRSR